MRAPPCIFFPGEPVEMVADLRSFHNRDLPQLVDVFRQHHGLAGHCADVSAAQFEQAILSRSFFDPDTLVVASQPGSSHPGSSKPGSSDCDTVLGWCQFGPLADRDSDSQESVLAAFCFSATCETATAMELVQEAMRRSDQRCMRLSQAGLFRDAHWGYAGLDPYGAGYGIDSRDVRAQAALQGCGFVAQQSLIQLVASTESYHPAFNRQSLQFRRSASVQQKRVLPDTIRRCAALSHLDIERHALVDRSGSVIGGMDFWFSDAEAQVMPPTKAIVDLPPPTMEGQLPEADSYLISAVVETLADRSVRHVETAVNACEKGLIDQMNKVGFKPVAEGCLFCQE